jgi:flotillin
MGELGTLPLVIGGVVALAILALVVTLKNFIVLVRPNMVAVITGRTGGDEAAKNYRFVSGGRTFRIPVIQDVSYLPLTTMSIPVDVRMPPPRDTSRCTCGRSPT